VARDYEHGVRPAVNHSGDSDSTRPMAGNLLGVIGGLGQVPLRWVAQLELHDVMVSVARDLAGARTGKNQPTCDTYPDVSLARDTRDADLNHALPERRFVALCWRYE
jgi:hypothetical protein